MTFHFSAGWLQGAAADLASRLAGAWPNASTGQHQARQVLCLAEEAGELVGAYRRWFGQARRAGTHEDMAAELADVVIAAYVAAEVLDVELERVISGKLDVIYSRGLRESAPTSSNSRELQDLELASAAEGDHA